MAMRVKAQKSLGGNSTIRKPLKGRQYFLHVNIHLETQLTTKITKLGGTVAMVLDNVHAVITDDCSGKMYIKYARQLAESRTLMTSSPADHYGAADSAYGTLSSSSRQQRTSNERGGKFQRHNSSELLSSTGKYEHYYQKMPSILRQAVDLHIKLITSEEICRQVDELESTFVRRRLNMTTTSAAPPVEKKVFQKKPNSLRSPCFKFEDVQQLYCPVYRQFTSWPTIHLRPGAKGSPFERRAIHNGEALIAAAALAAPSSGEQNRAKKFAYDNAADDVIVGVADNDDDVSKNKRRPMKSKLDLGGYCELCRYYADNLNAHLDSEFHHTQSISGRSFKTFDKLVNQSNRTLDQFVQSILSRPLDDVYSTLSSSPSSLQPMLTSTPAKEDTDAHNETLPFQSDCLFNTNKFAYCGDLKVQLRNFKMESEKKNVQIPVYNDDEVACVSNLLDGVERSENKSLFSNSNNSVHQPNMQISNDPLWLLESQAPRTSPGGVGCHGDATPLKSTALQQNFVKNDDDEYCTSPIFKRRPRRMSPEGHGSLSVGKRKLVRVVADEYGIHNKTIENETFVC